MLLDVTQDPLNHVAVESEYSDGTQKPSSNPKKSQWTCLRKHQKRGNNLDIVQKSKCQGSISKISEMVCNPGSMKISKAGTHETLYSLDLFCRITTKLLVFCNQNCSDLLWEKIVLLIQKNFWNLRLKAENLQTFWDHLNNLFKQWKVRTISGNRMLF